MPPPTAGDTAAPPQGPSPPRSLQSADACAVGCRRDADRIKPGEPAASALIWIIRPEDNGTWSWRKRWPAVNAAQKDELVDQFFTEMATQHEHIMGRDAHICTSIPTRNHLTLASYLHFDTMLIRQDFELIVTDPAYQRRGFALALLQRASQIADEMGYRMYLDAEKDVVPLYKSVGYVANEDVEHTSFMVPMVRPAKK